jgi:hypothetical protein
MSWRSVTTKWTNLGEPKSCRKAKLDVSLAEISPSQNFSRPDVPVFALVVVQPEYGTHHKRAGRAFATGLL